LTPGAAAIWRHANRPANQTRPAEMPAVAMAMDKCERPVIVETGITATSSLAG